MDTEDIWTGEDKADTCQPYDASSHGSFPFEQVEGMVVLARGVYVAVKCWRHLSG